ncbi:FdhF/YdeP family oxidoreductase [Marinivivus vitaminiproducens]|uniref:FdhF/YdeP family oxidoreductase n=1 Tax=Marinivivus vitaminiproducens TaxID=3035935 RepID=UPI00279E2855|nr:FdhF/YdeP family oxidoreductase [Geminicoccaceae bacterium SCSIO 64248]
MTIKPYTGPAGGWGSAGSVTEILAREKTLLRGAAQLMHQNKPDGYACVSCAWAKPEQPHVFEFCENGVKALAWEATPKQASPAFFERHSVTELLGWADYDLEEAGRLTEPLRYDEGSDRYVPVAWDEAFEAIARELKAIDPKEAVFYASGRASLETSYMYALLARMYGTNNLPDSSNMCHESTSVALPKSIGIPVGTVQLADFETCDALFFFGQNVGSNSPRMLHPLQEASRRGVPIVTFNPLRERGLERFTNPQAPLEMATFDSTRISSQYHQVKAGGDSAALLGMCKTLIERDDEARAAGRAPILDWPFIEEHTHGFDAFAASAREARWEVLEHRSGLTRGAMEAAAAVYARAERVIGIYGMGLTQHKKGVQNVQMVVNLLLLRGNIGRPGAGICPVRGHSNVQGQRTVGISEKPDLVPLDRLAELYGFEPPREKGMNTVEACEAILAGTAKAFIGLGGNFVRAVPETQAMESAWRGMRLTVQIATKLNRSHLINGKVAYLLPCLGRTEADIQAGGPQAVTVEDSTSCIHGSIAKRPPPGEHLRSEPAIVAGLAKALLPPNPKLDWDGWVADYARIRDAIEATYPDQFRDFNARMWQPGGFHRPLGACERIWNTLTGKANFTVPETLAEDIDVTSERRDVLQLITLRSNDQFNTTVYGYRDRFRGVTGTRSVLFMHRNDIDRLGLSEGQGACLETAVDDGIARSMDGLQVVAYDIPEGCCATYYPECNLLIPLWHHAEESKVPAAKAIPVAVRKSLRAPANGAEA